jgi:hypothetical protein
MLSIFLAVLMIGMTLTAFPITANAAATPINVSTAAELEAACSTINENGGEYTINLTADITGGHIEIDKSDAVVTVIGNSHTIDHSENGHPVINVLNGATLNLGSPDGGEKNALTIVSGVDNDDAGIVHVWEGSICNMYNNVTLKDHKGQNYLGGGVTVEGGTFHMHGGTIKNCGIDGGSVCYGGGVAVFSDGTFIMDDGVITECYANSDYIDDRDPNRCFTAMGGGVFVTAGSEFTMNGGTISNCEATNFGGGIAMTISHNNTDYSELKQKQFGKPQSTVTINDGTITANSADEGAGVFVSGYFYSFAAALAFTSPESGSTTQPGLYINGSTISDNEANDMGGGILIAMLRSEIKAQIHNAEIKNNIADNGAGIENFGYWTQLDIDGCTITGNTAVTNGGGVMLSTNTSGGYTNLKNTTVTGNKSGDRGAGVYYDNNSKLNISGANVIQNNTYNGVLNNLNVLSLAKPVYVIGALTGSQIGLSDPTLWDDGLPDEDAQAVSTEYLTSGYKANNPEVHPSEYFTSDHETWIVDRSVKTVTEKPDEASAYSVYTVDRYPVESIGKYLEVLGRDFAPYAANQGQYDISDIQKPELKNKSGLTQDEIIEELVYRFSDENKYTVNKTTSTYAPNYLKYDFTPNPDTPLASSPLSSITLIRQQNDQKTITLAYNAKQIVGDKQRGSSVTYTADSTNQPYPGKLLLKITNNGSQYLNDDYYRFSADSTETTTLDYVFVDPQVNTLYEYDKETSDITAKLVVKSSEKKYAKTTTIESGTDDEVRLVRADINYHINNDVIDDKYGNNDIFTSYVEDAIGKDVKVGDTIDSFYLIPKVVPTQQNSCPYIFKGWYYDQNNENDTRPVDFGTDKYTKDIYAHWIKVDNVTKDENDPTMFQDGDEDTYGGFDLAGVQIRKEMHDYNFDNKPKMPGGMRFITSLSMDVVNEINAIKPNNIEYGYVAATHEGWINYHKGHEKLQYVSETANGIDTSSAEATNENYFGFAHNVKCTSRIANSQNNEVRVDHQNFGNYLLYSFVVTYEGEDAARKDTNVLARPYIHYTDANGLERVAYSEYTGVSNVLGGCYTNYNTVAAMAGN